MSELKKVKPEIEDVINDVLSGDARKYALDFVAYLREHKLNPKWAATNSWKVSSKTFNVCFIRLHGAAEYNHLEPGAWVILPFIGEYEGDALSDEMKEIVWAHKKNCQPCGQCALPVDSIFGKQFAASCEGSIAFKNPEPKTVECAKKLIALRRDAIKEGKTKKHVYAAMRNR